MKENEIFIVPCNKHNYKLNIWGCITKDSVGPIFIFTKNMNAIDYVNILKNNLSLNYYNKEIAVCNSNLIYQQDNDPKHTSKIATQYFETNQIIKIDWPAYSPDMNIIEHIWKILKERVLSRIPQNIKQFKKFIKEEWYSISNETIKNLYNSKPKRINELKLNKGSYTNY